MTHKFLKTLNLGDLCHRRYFDKKNPVRIESLCEVIKVRKRGVIEERNTDINAVNNICIKQSAMGRYTRELAILYRALDYI